MVVRLELTKETLIDKPMRVAGKMVVKVKNTISASFDGIKNLKNKRIKIVDKD